MIFNYIVIRVFRWGRDRAKPQTVPTRFETGASQSLPEDEALVGENTYFVEAANGMRDAREIGIRGIPNLQRKPVPTGALAPAAAPFFSHSICHTL